MYIYVLIKSGNLIETEIEYSQTLFLDLFITNNFA